MNPKRIASTFTALVLVGASALAGTGTISVDARRPGPRIPSSLYGIFLEEISHAGEGGLYAELIQNRGFEDANLPPACTLHNGNLVPPRTPHFWEAPKVSGWTMPWPVKSKHPAWSLDTNGGAATIDVVDVSPLNAANPHSLQVSVASTAPTRPAAVVNEGFWGMEVRTGHAYDLSLYARTDGTYRGPIVARLIGQDGRALASHTFRQVGGSGWRKLKARLRAKGGDPKARLSLGFPTRGIVWLDHVSLLPTKTFKNRPNGLRPDLVKMIADLKPAFVRWPGGCVVEGITVEARPRWEQTLGPVEARVPTYSPWGYWNTNGFGYHEWLQFCEDVGAEALYVFNAGVACAFRSGTFLPDEDLPALIQNTLDGIEYAIGPTSSKWGALRAKNGHPKPFPLTVVEIGNEQQGPRYGQRVAMFTRAIKAKYPQLKVALSSWISGIDQPAIDAAGRIDIVDEHAYRPVNWAIANFDSFAKYPRNVNWELYIGEFATNSGVGAGNLMATLNDAAYMMSMEKNSDLVTMGSYAPLLENVNDRDWPVNLIHFDSSRSFGRASYYACRLFAEHRPDVNLSTQVSYVASKPQPIVGPVGLGTFSTAVEFKDVEVVQAGRAVYRSDFSNQAAGWTARSGQWAVQNGAYVQKDPRGEHWTYFGEGYGNVTLTAKARKLEGDEGFIVSVGNADGRRVQFNVGGWGNTRHAIQADDIMAQSRGRIEPNRWYEVKVETNDREVRAYLDGQLVLQRQLPRVDTVLAISGRDEKTGEIVLKVVNSGPEPASMAVRLDGLSRASAEGTLVQLSSASPKDENSFEQPTKIVPVTTKIGGLGPRFTREFPPYSLSILRVKAR